MTTANAADVSVIEPIPVASDLGFPEFESFHLMGFPVKAQFSKSAASTIPPCPRSST